MNVFWLPKPLAAQQAKLLNLTLAAHQQCAMRDNISTVVLRNTALGSGSFTNAVSAALCSVGALHAPLAQTAHFLASFNADDLGDFARAVETGFKVPGWGSDFVKDGPDPTFRDIDAQLSEHWPDLHGRITRITDELHARGKHVWPNMACYTAATAIVVELPVPLIGWIFIQGRLAMWAREFYNTLAAQSSTTQAAQQKEVV